MSTRALKMFREISSDSFFFLYYYQHLSSCFLGKWANMTKEVLPLVQIRDLSRWYKKGPKLFHSLRFQLQEWDFCIIQGKSWSGKTTLVKMLTGSLPVPKWKVFFRSEDMARLSRKEIQDVRKHVWIVFQDNKLLSHASIKENVCFPLRLKWVNRGNALSRYRESMKLVWLSRKGRTNISKLSGWETQKVAIARALAHSPDFVIADEPTGNLDREASTTIADCLINIHKSGKSIIMISHDQQLINYITQHDTIKHYQL